MAEHASPEPNHPARGATRARLVELFTDADRIPSEAFFTDLDEVTDAGLRDAYERRAPGGHPPSQ